jgi:hypothetical protein
VIAGRAAACGPGHNEPEYLIGLDLGQVQDPTALVVLRRTWVPDPRPHVVQVNGRQVFARRPDISHYLLNHLQRWPLHTPYPQIVSEVVSLVEHKLLVNPTLVVDQTGVGQAVVDMLRASKPKAAIKPVLITAGHKVNHEDGVWKVPKTELVGVLRVLFQTDRMKIAALPNRDILLKELAAFRTKVTAAGNETFEAWRERDHDDLVLGSAIACWYGERARPPVHGGGAAPMVSRGDYRGFFERAGELDPLGREMGGVLGQRYVLPQALPVRTPDQPRPLFQ